MNKYPRKTRKIRKNKAVELTHNKMIIKTELEKFIDRTSFLSANTFCYLCRQYLTYNLIIILLAVSSILNAIYVQQRLKWANRISIFGYSNAKFLLIFCHV
jgi:hypothetical protein